MKPIFFSLTLFVFSLKHNVARRRPKQGILRKDDQCKLNS